MQVQAGGRLGRFFQVDAQVAVTDTAGAPGDGARERAEIAYRRARFYSGGWADNTDPGFFAADGFLPADVVGTTGRGAYTGYTRQSGQSWLRSTDASVSYQVRETQTGERQREAASVYVGANTAANVQVSAGVTTGSYRPRGPTPGAWLDVVNDDRSYQAAANYQSPSGQFGYGAQYTGASPARRPTTAWHRTCGWRRARISRSATASSAPPTITCGSSTWSSGTWQIGAAQALAARWVEDDGGYYRLSYRRSLLESMDAFGVYSSDPYEPRRFDLKLVWTLSALSAALGRHFSCRPKVVGQLPRAAWEAELKLAIVRRAEL